MNTHTRICQYCEGKGRLLKVRDNDPAFGIHYVVDNYYDYTSWSWKIIGRVVCPKCNGKRRIKL